jgi:tetratricopeptide (TPR) repeat protein
MSTRVVECQQYNTVGNLDADFEKLGDKDSIELLLKSAKIPPKERDQLQVLDHARKVVGDDCLGQHALAITQAGAFISQRLCTLKEYPAMFKKQRLVLLKHRQKQAESQYGDVYATFEVSAEAMKATKSSHRQEWVDALELLNILAFLYREGVTEEMFIKAWTKAIATTKEDPKDEIWLLSLWHVNHMRRILRQSSDSPKELDLLSLRKARGALQSFSLITIHQDTGDISMHPLVHAWAKDRLAADAQNIAWATAASILSLSIESFEYHEFFHKIHSHIEFSVGPDPEQLFANSKYPGLEIGRILYHFTYVIYYLGNNSHLAEVVANVLCSRIGSEISRQSRNWRDALYLQAMSKTYVAKYNEQIDILKKVVSFDKDNLPAEDPDSVRALKWLGIAHLNLGKYPEAIGLLEDVLQTNQKLLPPTHPERLASQHELASAYLQNNQVDKAIEIFEEVVQIQEKALPPTHPDRLVSQHGLARAYLESNQVNKAIELFKEVVQIQEKALPPTHPNRLGSQQELARAYYERGEYQKALPIIQEVVRIRSEQDEPSYWPRVHSERVLSRCRSRIEREVSRSGIIPDASGAAAVQDQ